MYTSKSKRYRNMKPSAYYLYVKTKIPLNFHICISVPLMLNYEQKLKMSIAIFCRYGLALPTDKILQALELSILTWTDWFRNISPKLSRTYLTASNSLCDELFVFHSPWILQNKPLYLNVLKWKPPYPSSLASVNTRQVVNALSLNVYPL